MHGTSKFTLIYYEKLYKDSQTSQLPNAWSLAQLKTRQKQLS